MIKFCTREILQVLTICVYFVSVWIDKINGDPEVMLRQQFMFVVTFQRRGIVLDEAIGLKRIRYKLGIEWNIWEIVAVLDATHQVRSGCFYDQEKDFMLTALYDYKTCYV